MKGDPKIIDTLNERLIDEATGIAQYLAHRATLNVWEYPKLVDYINERIEDERRHFDILAERIVFLEGTPAVGVLNEVNVGGYVRQMLGNDLAVEVAAIENYRESIQLCLECGDAKTRTLLESILSDEDDHTRDIEALILQMNQMTAQNFLSAKI